MQSLLELNIDSDEFDIFLKFSHVKTLKEHRLVFKFKRSTHSLTQSSLKSSQDFPKKLLKMLLFMEKVKVDKPACVAHLDPSLSDVDRDHFSHPEKKLNT